MIVEVRVPEVGESITEGVLVEWHVEDGAIAKTDEPLFELETDKVTMSVAAMATGRVSHELEVDAKVQVGQIVGRIDTSAAAEEAAPASEPAAPAIATPAGFPQAAEKVASAKTQPDDLPLTPAVRRVVDEHGLDATRIPASGRDGRLTKEDVLAHLAATKDTPDPTPAPAAPAPAAPAPKASTPKASAPTPPPPVAGARGTTRARMTTLRQRIAERLVEAQHNAAMLTTFNEVDMSKAMAFRAQHKEAFEKQHGVRLGFMSFFVKAVVDALRRYPAVNARIEGDEIVYHHYADIGVAVGTEQGLVVPVLRDADQRSFAQIEKGIGDLAKKARERKLTIQDLTGGTFSITNGGVYGSLMSTPILNPPQSGILGMHGIKKRPIAVDDAIEIRPMMYVALSYDHRIIDGKDAVGFLKRVVECVDDPERMLLEA